MSKSSDIDTFCSPWSLGSLMVLIIEIESILLYPQLESYNAKSYPVLNLSSTSIDPSYSILHRMYDFDENLLKTVQAISPCYHTVVTCT